MLMDKLTVSEVDFSKIIAISGTAQVIMLSNTFDNCDFMQFNNLSATRFGLLAKRCGEFIKKSGSVAIFTSSIVHEFLRGKRSNLDGFEYDETM